LRIGLTKFRKRRSAPDAAWIADVLPEVVELPAAPCDIGNVVGPVVECRQRVAICRKGRAAELIQRQVILSFDEIERAPAVDFFQPEIGIVIGGGQCRPVVDGHARTPWTLAPC
jgi:hypothetical protein